MFGKNEVAKTRSRAEGLLVHSIFYTIQGEGPWAGLPTIFVRLARCNLRCFWCDTEFEQGAQHYEVGNLVGELMERLVHHRCRRIVVTGGEPLLQEALVPLIASMQEYVFQVETAGTVWPQELENYLHRVTVVTSPKTPRVHPMIERHTHAWKYILRAGECAAEDGLPILSTQKQGEQALIYRAPALHEPFFFNRQHIYVQPCDEQDPVRNAANLEQVAKSAMTFGYRMSVQMHKLADLP